MPSDSEGDPASRTSMVFDRAIDPDRRARTSLYVVVYRIADTTRRTRIRRIVASFGQEVAPHVHEVPTSPSGIRVLERCLSYELQPEDSLRIYPVCARCRGETRVWGDVELAGLTPALIF